MPLPLMAASTSPYLLLGRLMMSRRLTYEHACVGEGSLGSIAEDYDVITVFIVLRSAAGHLQPCGPAAAAPLQGGREL